MKFTYVTNAVLNFILSTIYLLTQRSQFLKDVHTLCLKWSTILHYSQKLQEQSNGNVTLIFSFSCNILRCALITWSCIVKNHQSFKQFPNSTSVRFSHKFLRYHPAHVRGTCSHRNPRNVLRHAEVHNGKFLTQGEGTLGVRHRCLPGKYRVRQITFLF